MASLEVKTVQCQKYSLGFKMLDGSLHPTKVPFYMSPCLCRLICKMQKPTTTAGKKKKLQLANWLKEQHRSEVVLCSEGNQKLSVGSLYVILSLLPCWHHVLLQKMGFTQNKENMATVAPQLHPQRNTFYKKSKVALSCPLRKMLP